MQDDLPKSETVDHHDVDEWRYSRTADRHELLRTIHYQLANKGHSISLTNLEDMVKKGTHSLCIRNDSTAYVYFTMIKIETKKIYKYNTNCCIRIFG
ncbi:PREDICTED: uncharacterized protein LOC108769256 [Trachymyrmex cornetzi]|uniref:uncharacterized protein LOC108769256 n=1 Tax=Trachymyrmex cornetzi TaxID=471704 RepID=UPI00084F57B4|nr:PREDICTED: uncharacterized protein LOC108769256 [Trachymyrmex cornetzi]